MWKKDFHPPTPFSLSAQIRAPQGEQNMSNLPNGFGFTYTFSGAGFTNLDLNVGATSYGTLTNPSFESSPSSQPTSLRQLLNDIKYDSATGSISFSVAEGFAEYVDASEPLQNVAFVGTVVNDGTGVSGTWQGERLPIIKGFQREAAANFPPLPIATTVQGVWTAAAVVGGIS
jgi:hypothetical protein